MIIQLQLQVIALLEKLLTMMKKREYIIIHHTGGSDADPYADTSHHTVSMVDSWHKKIGFNKSKLGYYVGYHYFIEKDGKVTQCRMHDETGCHTVGYNQCIGICLAGNFDATLPSNEQIASTVKLLKQLKQPNTKIVPHRKFAPHKTCYGSKLADNYWDEAMKYWN